MAKGERTLEACLQRYRDSAKERRALALEYIDGLIGDSYFEERWQLFDVLGEVTQIQRERDEAREAALEKQRRHEAKLAAQEAINQ